MRLAFVVVGVAAGLAATGGGGATLSNAAEAKPSPAKPSADAPCADRFAEPDCRQRIGCQWIAAYKRGDGTYAIAYCSGDRSNRPRRGGLL